MPEYGLTDAGFVPKRLDEIKTSLETALVGIFGENTDNDPDSPNGQIVGTFSGALSEVWEIMSEVVTIFDPSAAGGVLQSKQVRLNGITRGEDAQTVVLAEVVGTIPNTLQAGAVAETSDAGDRFVLLSDVIFTGGSDAAIFVAEQVGPVPCEAATLTVITSPRNGWVSVTNAAASASIGTIEEGDGILRRRREKTTEAGAVNILTAMEASVAGVVSVTDSKVLNNETGSVNALGLPAKSYRVIAEGGTDDAIAQAIWNKHPTGIENSGAESGNAVDINGNAKVMNFDRPVEIPIHAAIILTKTGDYPADGDDLMKQALVDYAAGSLEGWEHRKFGIGDDVLWSRLYEALNTIPGHTVNSLNIDTDGAPVVGLGNIAMTDLQKSSWDVANISVA